MIQNNPTFIDLFAGCGGLSLGLFQAGWQGIFAVEQNNFAFNTLEHNLIKTLNSNSFDWPTWLPKKEITIQELLRKYKTNLTACKGKINLIAGGPPCQGFSLVGKRNKNDPRNNLYKEYVELVGIVKPNYLLIENVRGIITNFFNSKSNSVEIEDSSPKSYAERICDELNDIGYSTAWKMIKAADFGVPQYRPRYIMLGVNRDLLPYPKDQIFLKDSFLRLSINRPLFLMKKGLPCQSHIGVKEAISDLETLGRQKIQCDDSSGFEQVVYGGPRTVYQKLMHGNLNGSSPNSMRLAKHREKTINTFNKIMETCRPGVTLSNRERAALGINKHCVVWLDANKPAHTLTTLPDDLLHYSEPRILTVREYARLQSFPDWFEFKGNYTTGGPRRKNECPRYTQIGNAVPPLLAEAIGHTMLQIYDGF